VDATIVNVAGRPVRQLVAAQQAQAGVNRLHWDGRGTSGTRVPAGRYIVRLTARLEDGQQVTRIAPMSVRR